MSDPEWPDEITVESDCCSRGQSVAETMLRRSQENLWLEFLDPSATEYRLTFGITAVLHWHWRAFLERFPIPGAAKFWTSVVPPSELPKVSIDGVEVTGVLDVEIRRNPSTDNA